MKTLPFNPGRAELIKMPLPLQIFSQSDGLIQFMDANSLNDNVDPDQLASEEANWSGSTLWNQGIPVFSRTRVKVVNETA